MSLDAVDHRVFHHSIGGSSSSVFLPVHTAGTAVD